MHTEEDMTVYYFHHTGRAEHSDPSFLCYSGHPHPCDHSAKSVFIECSLRGVEIQTVVEVLVCVGNLQGAGSLIESYRETDGLVPLFYMIRKELHRGEHQDFPAICLKVVRAFPHPSVFRTFPCLVYIGPCVKVFAPVEEDFSVLLLNSAAEDQIPCIFSAPDLRISCVGPVPDGWICDRGNDDFLAVFIVKAESILRGDHKLG